MRDDLSACKSAGSPATRNSQCLTPRDLADVEHVGSPAARNSQCLTPETAPGSYGSGHTSGIASKRS
jgi:hypothetical protein